MRRQRSGSCNYYFSLCGFPEAFVGDVGYFGNPRKKAGAGFSSRRGVGFCQLWVEPILQFTAVGG